MKGLPVVAACVAALAVAAPAAAALRLAPSDRQAINATLDIFVNHAVKRKDVGAAYGVVTQTLRGGMTRKQWARGDIGVYPYPARGSRFHAWTIEYRTREEIAIQLELMPRRGSKLGPIIFHVYLQPAHRRWLVDEFMPAATLAPLGKPAVVQAAADFMANPSAQTYNRPNKEKRVGPVRISGAFIFVPFAFIGLLLTGLAGWGATRWIRSRRFDARASRALPPSPLSIRGDGAGARPSHRS